MRSFASGARARSEEADMIEFFATPGVHSQKVRIMLEETGLAHVLRTTDPAVADATFFGRSPSLHDPDGPDGLRGATS
jgi:hypothetical protein